MSESAADAGRFLLVTRSVAIPMHELTFSVSPAGGPGGQHANRSHTRVEVRFDITTSAVLGPVQRSRLLERYGPELRVVCGTERSQARNRAKALEVLAERLRKGLAVRPARRATAPTRAAVERRLESKHRRAVVKQTRRRPADD
ncbi:MAG TPA: alternative ribosome rescue aminoacyl-tRNA hydrolase ArfB [Acidimicrobiales bacterium]